MRVARAIASLLTLGPIAGIVGHVDGKTRAYRLMGRSETETIAPQLADAISIALYSVAIGMLCYIIGVTAHLVIAKRSQVYPRYAWYLILASSIIFLFEFPLGTVLGGITITMLFTLQTFKNMKTVEPAPRPVPSKAAVDGGL